MAVSPDDVAADHAALLLVVGVVGAVEGEVAQCGELGLDAVEPGAVRGGVGDLDVVRRSPGTDPLALLRGEVRGEVVADDRDTDFGRVEGAQVSAELQELGAPLDGLDVAVELVLGQVQGGEQVPDPAVAVDNAARCQGPTRS
ncbi:hypothetical protein GCM10010430_65930 [Kitasatospora cystarginea]|uniref:Uncharacterized protein n=1 Tax=Kitasatospora cystarginea TaxID=58350 RepID=A0ABN3EUP2_9ACTN